MNVSASMPLGSAASRARMGAGPGQLLLGLSGAKEISECRRLEASCACRETEGTMPRHNGTMLSMTRTGLEPRACSDRVCSDRARSRGLRGGQMINRAAVEDDVPDVPDDLV